MKAYVALLRGINVGGAKPLRMEDLRALCADLGFAEVKTYIQSGNVVFKAKAAGDAALAASIEKAIAKRFKFAVPVIVRSVEELARIVAANPYPESKLKANEKPHITFLSAAPAKDKAKALRLADDVDECRLVGSEVYILCRDGYGETRFNNAFLEKSLGVKATTRNLATTRKLIEMGSEP